MNDIEVKAIEFIKFYKEHCLKQEQENMKNGNYETVNDEQFVYKNLEIVLKLIENLLTRNKDLEEINEAHKKENGELRERVKELEKEKEDLLCDVYDLFIRKSLIKQKIEELIKEGRHYNASKIEVLQELLEKRK